LDYFIYANGIRSSITYINNIPNWTQFQKDIIANFDFKSLFHHYLSLAHGNINLLETEKNYL